MGWLSDWRRARILHRFKLDDSVWHSAAGAYSFTRRLSEPDRARLREVVTLFLHDKAIHGAAGLSIREEIRIAVAIQACVLILNLDLEYFRGWNEIVVYPDEFVVDYEYTDDDGVVHRVHEPVSGESWLQGPVVLSWADTAAADQGSGYNVVIHEFAHKIDMLNGDANGFPPLHPEMDREEWTRIFSDAYSDFCLRAERAEMLPLDSYAAEDPAEFFAVASEAFFEVPEAVQSAFPDVYRQLALFYRQDPVRLSSLPSNNPVAAAGIVCSGVRG